MKKIKIFLIGGLGNNLFQLSYGENLKKEGFNVQYNTFLKEKNVFTSILGWTIHPSGDLDSLLEDDEVSKNINLIDFSYLLFVYLFKALNLVDFQTSCKNKIFWGRGIGYWQKYVPLDIGFIKKVKKSMLDSVLHFSEFSKAENVLHVRRGDFQSADQLSIEYYRNALNRLKEKKYTLVTDDKSIIDEFRNVFKNEFDFQLSTAKSLSQDLSIIANSNKLIMSNSTFCYWASQIGEVETVIYPSQLSKRKNWCLELNNSNAIKLKAFFIDVVQR